MVSIFSSIFIYLLAFVSHIIVHRILVWRGVRTPKTYVVFGVGLVVLASVAFQPAVPGAPSVHLEGGLDVHLPWTSLLLYTLLSGITMVFVATPMIGERGPTSKLLSLLAAGPKTLRELLSHFDDDELFTQRVESLVVAGVVEKKGGKFVVSERGQLLARGMDMYCQLLNHTPGSFHI